MEYHATTFRDRYPRRATKWRLRTQTLDISAHPLWMGIVNVTPDSFSDGGSHLEADAAIDRALELVEQGADLLDIGGESTRPYSERVTAAEELRRVIPVLEKLLTLVSVPVSIDTSKAEVAQEALQTGVEIINDVTGLEGDPEMLSLARATGAAVCAMHMQGTPQTMQEAPQYGDVVGEIHDYLLRRRDNLAAAGIERDRICLDPGIGFGKTHQHNLTLMANCHAFHDLGCPLLVGHSRKGFLAKILNDKEATRGAATVGAALSLARQGVHVIRLHEVRPAREAYLAFAATGGINGKAWQLGD